MLKDWQKQFIFFAFLIIFLIIAANRTLFFSKGFLEEFASDLTYPVIYLSEGIADSIKKMSSKKESYNKLEEQYLKLKEENDKLINANIKLSAAISFEQNSKDLIDFQKRYNLTNAILSKVISKNFSETEHFVLINKGENDNIKKDMIAIYKFQIIGRVVEVNNWYSKIMLITDQNCKVSAYTNTTNAPGIVIGENKLDSYKMAYVSHLTKIEVGDFIISSGQGLIFPEGFCLGKIKEYKTEGLYHKITLEPLTDLNSIDYCLLITQEKMDVF